MHKKTLLPLKVLVFWTRWPLKMKAFVCLFVCFCWKARDHVSKDTVSCLKGLDSLIALSVLNLPTRDTDFRNLVPSVRDSGFPRGMNEIFAFQGCNAVLIGIYRLSETTYRFYHKRSSSPRRFLLLPLDPCRQVAPMRLELTTSQRCVTSKKSEDVIKLVQLASISNPHIRLEL
jgi:hypothetical protein